MSELKHYGMPRRSGRYPWGSGEFPYQSEPHLRGHVNSLKKQGLTEKEISLGMGMSIAQLRAEISLEKSAQRQEDSAFAQKLKDKGYSNVAIGKRMGINESSVRNLLDPVMQERAAITEKTADMLKRQVNEKLYLDVGAGVENHIGVSRNRLDISIAQLQKQGYKLQYIEVRQLGTDHKTSIKVLTKDDVDYKNLAQNKHLIQTITEWTDDGGRSYLGVQKPASVASNRIKVIFAEDGGTNMDGVIQLRRGAKDLSLGDARYAQVRIAVDGTHFLKGMAIYSDDMPKGIDILYNTNKSQNVPILGDKDNTVFKPMHTDKDNPFKTDIRQKTYLDEAGNKHLSAINVVGLKPGTYEEGAWGEWSKTLSSQMLSKQAPSLAKQQLDLAIKIQQEEFNQYSSLTNPAVKKILLGAFADQCDADAVHLKAAAMPRQGNYVLLPSNDLKPNEIYAPNYIDGESVILIRHPHGGIFEIPELRVNNNNPKVESIFRNVKDAVLIHPSVAQKLSGADFDGDSVLVIPNKNNQIKTAPSLRGLKDFDPQTAYPGYSGMKSLSPLRKETEMGKISNLITDMTIKGAPPDEIARAVRHSMVVIDAEKHNLDYERSFQDNRIADLKEIYQGGKMRGASTLISRAKSQERIDRRKEGYSIDPKTGKKIFVSTGETLSYIKDPNDSRKKIYINYPKIDSLKTDPITGKKIFVIDYKNPYFIDPITKAKVPVSKDQEIKTVNKQQPSTKMYEVADAHILSSGTRMESIYADYANELKAMGDQARKLYLETPPLKYSPSAKKVYQPQIDSLKSKLYIAVSNKPTERQALLLANYVVDAKRNSNPHLTKAELKKINGQALAEARHRVGAKKQSIEITPLEWEAIQAGAISNSFLMQILNNTNLDLVKQYATPRTKKGLTTAQLSKARLLLAKGYTQAEVAQLFGISASALMNAVEGLN